MTDDKADSEQDETASDHSELVTAVTMILLLLITIIIAFHTEFLVRSISSFTVKIHILNRFVDLILILIIENTIEYMTAIIMIYKHKMNLVIEIMLESDVQVIIFLLLIIMLIR